MSDNPTVSTFCSGGRSSIRVSCTGDGIGPDSTGVVLLAGIGFPVWLPEDDDAAGCFLLRRGGVIFRSRDTHDFFRRVTAEASLSIVRSIWASTLIFCLFLGESSSVGWSGISKTDVAFKRTRVGFK